MNRLPLPAALATALVLATLPVQAQTRTENLNTCYDDDAANDHPDSVIAACTALIAANQETADNLSDIYLLRGDAYENKNLHDQAIADWRMALKFNPHNGGAGIGLAMKGVSP